MHLPFQKIVGSEEETSAVAAEFSQQLKTGDVVCLNGNLGSGKTFFVKSVCKEFLIDTTSSPSFAIVNEYKGKQKITHFDFYRLKRVEELHDIGFEEYLSEMDSIVFIEWANMFEELLPKKYYTVEISQIDETTRQININKHE
ncbi:MAG: tRNA (adenosine(37)-N6)-threonylcarbamoyltransferase complex ATPase subunit type 1 TsaE [Ignavibacteriales bacterium]|nr:tRNA (adenosine(37)-N6)-threonylcarbamoyltransferase complex ATPase subunit type 1 TsaE [Ignavibacteriales bacterium]